MQDPRYIVITGGARGIGRAVAGAFVKNGDRVLIVSRTLDELKKAKAELGSAVFIYDGDVSNPKDIKAIRAFIETTWQGRLDVLVNAAGIYGPIGPLEDNDFEKWTQTIAINFLGTVAMCQMAIPFMKKRGGGRIVNFSGGGDQALPNFTAYSSSKRAVVGFTESLAAELKNHNIFVNAIAPGAVNTKFLDNLLVAGPEKVGKEIWERSIRQRDDGGQSPEKAAELIVWLASPEAAGITGKYLSAIWDNYRDFPNHLEEIRNSEIYNLRRVKPEDRGKNWEK